MAELFGKADRVRRRPRRPHAPGRLLASGFLGLQRDRRRRPRHRDGRRARAELAPGRPASRSASSATAAPTPGRTWEFVNLAAALEAAADRGVREQLVRRRDPDHRGDGGRVGRQPGVRLRPACGPGRRPGRRSRCTAWRPRARRTGPRGGGPTFIEALTYRYDGHNIGDAARLPRPAEVVDWWQPTGTRSTGCGAALDAAGDLDEAALRRTAAAAPRAGSRTRSRSPRRRPCPDPATVADGVTAHLARPRGPVAMSEQRTT